MRLMVCGSRTITDRKWVFEQITSYVKERNLKDIIIVEGEAKGIDTLARNWAERHMVQVEKYPADWSIGKQAGFLRNIQMYNVADEVLILWDGSSRGAEHDIKLCKKGNKPYKIVIYS